MATRRTVRQQPPDSRRQGQDVSPEPQRVIEILCSDTTGKALWERAVAIATNELLARMVTDLQNEAQKEVVPDGD